MRERRLVKRKAPAFAITIALLLVGIPGTLSVALGTPLPSCSGVGALGNGSFENISGTPTWTNYSGNQANDNLFGSEPAQVTQVGTYLQSPGMQSWNTTASDSKIEAQRVRLAGSYAATVTASSATAATLEIADSDNAPFTGQDVQISGTRYNVSSGRTSLAALADPYAFTIDTSSAVFSVGQSVTYAVAYSVSSAIDDLFASTYYDYSTVEAGAGTFFAELNANQVSMLYQDVDTVPGTVIFWSLMHQGRSKAGSDEMQVKIGTTSSQTAQTDIIKVSGGSTSAVTTIVTGRGSDGNGWATYRGSYTVPAGQTITRFGFESVSANIGSTVGNFLDNIMFTPLAACPLTRSAVAGSSVTINPFDSSAANFAYAPAGSTISSASITTGGGSLSITNASTRLSFTPPSEGGSTVINYTIAYSQDNSSVTSEGTITVTTAIQRPTISWTSPNFGNDVPDAACSTGTVTQTTDGATRRVVITAPSQSASSTGCTFTPPAGVNSVDVLVVAGGGGGGARFVGGGGGAGGYRSESGRSVTPGSAYAVSVGAGGAGGANSGTAASAMGSDGSSSSFDTLTATGGGGGGGFVASPGQVGRPGGSGGGGSGSATQTIAGGAASPSGQGSAGGSGTVATGQNPGGGGGGSAGVGGNGGSSGGGAGGSGTSNDITGTFVTYAAGGGGGADSAAGGGAGGSSDVGGRGGNVNTAGSAATADRGSGGGGAGGGAGQTGGRGSAGIVILRYSLGTTTTVPAPGTATGTWSVTSSGGGIQGSGTAVLQSAPYANASCGTWSDLRTATSGTTESTAVNTCYRWTFDHALSSAAVAPTDLAGNATVENLTSIGVVALSPTLSGPADFRMNVSASQTVGTFTANGFTASTSITTSITLSGVSGTTFSLPTTTGLTRTSGSSWTSITSVTFTSSRANAVAALSAMTIGTGTSMGSANLSVTISEGSASATDSVAVNVGWVARLPDDQFADPQAASVLIASPYTDLPSVTNLALCAELDSGVSDGVIDISRSGGNAVGGNPDDGAGTLMIFGDQTRQVSASGAFSDVVALLPQIRFTWTSGASALSSARTITVKLVEIPRTGLAFNCTNNHFYELIDVGAGTTTSFNSAQSTSTSATLTVNGISRAGYLATLTAQIEQEIVDRLSLKSGLTTSDVDHTNTAIVGGSDAGVEGIWCWTAGPEASGSTCSGAANSGTRFFVDSSNSAGLSGASVCSDGIRGTGACAAFPTFYQFWQSGEPNDGGGAQEYLTNGYCAGTASCGWDDLGAAGTTALSRYYIREYGSNVSSDFVPSITMTVTVHALSLQTTVSKPLTIR